MNFMSFRKTGMVALVILFISVFGPAGRAQTGGTVLFANSSPQLATACQGTGAMSLDTLLALTDGDGFGDFFPGLITLSLYAAPAHGTAVVAQVVNYAGGVQTPVGLTYTPTPGFYGTDIFKVMAIDTFGNVDTTTIVMTITTAPGPISGAPFVCVGGTTVLTDSVAGGSWTSSDGTIATAGYLTGLISGISTGTAIITYSTGCGTDVTKSLNVYVTSAPITGLDTVCTGNTITLSDTTVGGTWSSSSPSIASVSGTGIVSGLSFGTSIITYDLGCGLPATLSVYVGTTPFAGTITAVSPICVGSTSTFTDGIVGGTWSSASTSIATVGSSGLVTGASGGTTTISYTVSGICGTATASAPVTITPLPTVAAIAGGSTVCVGASLSLTDATGSGTWSTTSSTIAAVSIAGVVTGSVAGLDTVRYSVSNSCGSTVVSAPITVNPLPTVGYIYGLPGVCASNSTTFADAATGGTWSSTNTTVATVSGGVVAGVAAGTDTIKYTSSNICGSLTTSKVIVVGTTPVIATIAGNDTSGYSGDGLPGVRARIYNPYGVAADGSGNVYFADIQNNRIRKVNPYGIISTVAGTGTAGFSGDGGAATAAALNYPSGVAADGAGNVYFCDALNNRVRKISTSGIISTVAGNGTAGFLGDAGNATAAELNNPLGVAVDAGGDLFISDYNNNRVRKVNTFGTISTVAGTGAAGYTGDGGVATSAAINAPAGLAVDVSGNLYIACSGNNAIREVNIFGNINTIAGSSTGGYSGDGGPATAALLSNPTGIAIDGSGNLFIADQLNNRVRKIASGTITTYAGTGTSGFLGDGGSATAADLYYPSGVAVNAAGAVYVSDEYNNVVRVISPVCACSGTPVAGIISATATSGCSTYASVLTLTGASGSPGITFQWKSSADGVHFSNVAGATNSNYTAVVSSPIYLKCMVTCTNSSIADSTTSVLLDEGLPIVGPISGAISICQGATATLTDATVGGTWSTLSVGSISTSGVLTGVSAGVALVSYTMTNGCGSTSVTYPVTINAAPAVSPISGTATYCISSSPATLTDTASGGTWSSTLPGVVTISGSGVVSVVSYGSSIISYTKTNTCGVTAATLNVTVYHTPAAGVLTGTGLMCTGASTSLADTAAGGVWTSSNTGIAAVSGGLVTGVAAGTAVISYTITNPCGSSFATQTVTVNPTSSSSIITGSLSFCQGGTTTLADTVAGGSWSSSDGSIAPVSSSGVVSGVSYGNVAISYSFTNSCGTTIAVANVTVNPLPIAGTITGTANLCQGTAATFTDGAGGGTWSSSATSVAAVSAGGVVTPSVLGTAIISYTVINSCGTAYAQFPVTVNAYPVAGTIFGGSTVCQGSTLTLTDAATGGTWSSLFPSVASVTGGVVSGLVAGNTVISYTVTNICGTAAAYQSFTVNPLPNAGSVVGTTSVCSLSAITLTDAATGGVWSSTVPSVATVVGGVVTGAVVGTTTISYTVTNSCGVIAATSIVTVNPLPNAGSLSGPSSFCFGSIDTLTDVIGGGSWTSTNPAVITVSSGVLTAVAVGSSTIDYAVTNSCGTAYATESVTVNPLPNAGSITGTGVVCVAATTTLADTVIGGTWISSNPALASVSGGTVTGISAGSLTISYSKSNMCGTAYATTPVTVNPLPYAGYVIGSSSVCAGLNDTLHNYTGFGIWSITGSAGIATISITGIVHAVSAGSAVVSYAVTNSCGTAYAAFPITVNPQPVAGNITGTDMVCATQTVTLADTASGGVWSSTVPTVATVSGGIVTGVLAGNTTISYTVTNICGTAVVSIPFTVNPLPVAGSITGATTLCVGSTYTFTDSSSGGTWSSGSSATVSEVGNIGTAATTGTATISYSVTNICGTAYATLPVSVYPVPNAGAITGVGVLCQGAVTTLHDTISGGTWSVTGASVASVSGTGLVSGLSAGLDTVNYVFTNVCGSNIASKVVTVNPLPNAGAISGSSLVCIGGTSTLSESVTGGIWSMKNAKATISGGVITGVTAGLDTAVYAVSNSCGTLSTTFAVVVGPFVGAISGPTSVCVGALITLSDSVSGGVWNATNGNASVAGGLVAGLVAGIDTVSYAITNACGTISNTAIININPSPNAGAITGSSTACIGSPLSLTDSIVGGTWAATNTRASVVGGVVSGINAGMDTVVYSVSNICGIATAKWPFTVVPVPYAGVVTGSPAVCNGASITLVDTVSGGIWTISNGNAAVAAGVVTGNTVGIDTVYYAYSNACGNDTARFAIAISPLPYAGTISGPAVVCAGSTNTLTDATTGGAWATSNGSATVVGGIYSGVNAGTDTVYYVFTNSCGADTARETITVNPLPVAGVIMGDTATCSGTVITLTDIATGGTWSSSNMVDSITTTGIFYANVAGLETVKYVVTNSCGGDSTTYNVRVNPLPGAGHLTGTSTVCAGSTISLVDTVVGGTWGVTNANATIAGGVVAAVTAGTDTAFYTISNICGNDTARFGFTINPLPVAGTITGASTVCTGTTSTLSDPASGGSWAASNGHLSVSGGVVTGNSAGFDTVSYSVMNGCGTATATVNVVVNPAPMVGPIMGSDSVCTGTTTTLTDDTTAGVWSDLGGHAVVSGGVVIAVTTGIDTIVYTKTNSCGSASAKLALNIATVPNANISGFSFACVGREDTLSGSPAGGTWSVSNSHATITGSGLGGIVTGVSAGLDTVLYHVSNQCGTSTAKVSLIIYASADCPLEVATTNAQADWISVYPNPSTGSFVIDVASAAPQGMFKVYDFYGRQVQAGTLGNSKTYVNLESFPKGNYLVKTVVGTETATFKVTIW